jgi:hypothetical protein
MILFCQLYTAIDQLNAEYFSKNWTFRGATHYNWLTGTFSNENSLLGVAVNDLLLGSYLWMLSIISSFIYGNLNINPVTTFYLAI